MLAEIDAQQARYEEMDVEGLLDFAQHLAENAGHLWKEADLDAKTRLQLNLFPQGIQCGPDGISNSAKSPLFSSLGVEMPKGQRMVSPTGFEPVSPA